MGVYGFEMTAKGDILIKMEQWQGAIKSLDGAAQETTRKIEQHFEGMTERIKEQMGGLKTFLRGALGFSAAFEGYQLIKNSKEAYDALEKSVTRVNQAVASTHGAAGFSGQAVEDMAKEMEGHITQRRAEILDAQGMLLSFTRIRGPVFKESMESIADFATFFKTDMTSAALMVGKALNDPIHGMSRLQRMGVAFTDEQKAQIKNYETQGNLVKAQEIILKELRNEFGGQAMAATTTDEGKLAMAHKKFEDFQFSIGKIFSELEVSLIPTFEKIMQYVQYAFNSGPIQFFLAHMKDMIDIALRLIPIWVTYRTVMAGASLITEVFAVKNGILTMSMGELTVMTDGSTVAVEGFESALASTGVGVFAIALGLVVEQFISMNQQMDDANEKLTHMKELHDSVSSLQNNVSKNTEFFENRGNMSAGQKANNYSDMLQTADQAREALNSASAKWRSDVRLIGKDSADAQAKALLAAKNGSMYYTAPGTTGPAALHIEARNQAYKDMKDAAAALKATNTQIAQYKAEGIKPITYKTPGQDNISQNGMITSLSGSSGGLGSAKIVNLHIDTMQRVEVKDGTDLVAAGQNAVEEMARIIDNIAYSSSRLQ